MTKAMSRRNFAILLLTLCFIAVTVLFLSTCIQQVYALSPTLSVFPTMGKVGSSVTITGNDFPSNTSYSISSEAISSLSGTTSATGGFSRTATISNNALPGPKSFTAVAGAASAGAGFYVLEGGIQLSKKEGIVGAEVKVTGGNFPSNSSVSIQWDGMEVKSTTSSSDGTFNASFLVPSSKAGEHQIKAIITTSGFYSLPETFTVKPSLTVDATEKWQAGTTFRVSGSGFSNNSVISITMEGAGAEWMRMNSDALGSFLPQELTVDEAAGGQWKIKVIDSKGNIALSDKSFTVSPRIFSVSSSSVQIGATIVIRGRGFRANEKGIGLYLVGDKLDKLLNPPIDSNEKGSFECGRTVPEMPAGKYNIVAKDSLGNSVTADSGLSIQPAIHLDTAEGHVNMRLKFSGTGYKANTDIRLMWDETPISLETPILSDSKGSCTGVILVPRCKSGPHTIVITDGSSRSSAHFEVEIDSPLPPTLLSPRNKERIGWLPWRETPTLKWTPVEDPSGIYYHLSIAKDESFKTLVLSKEYLTGVTYTLAKSEALEKGNYYWQVKAVDGAYNESKWSNHSILQIGSNLLFWLLGAFVFSLGGGGVFYRFSIGFTTQQRTTIAKAKEFEKTRRQEQQEKERAEQERINQIKSGILKLAQENRGEVRIDSITARLNIDSETAKQCLKKLKAHQENEWYYIPEIEKQYTKKN